MHPVCRLRQRCGQPAGSGWLSEDPSTRGCRKNPVNRLRTIATRGDTPVLALSIGTGALVAIVVAGFEYVSTTVLLERVLHRPALADRPRTRPGPDPGEPDPALRRTLHVRIHIRRVQSGIPRTLPEPSPPRPSAQAPGRDNDHRIGRCARARGPIHLYRISHRTGCAGSLPPLAAAR